MASSDVIKLVGRGAALLTYVPRDDTELPMTPGEPFMLFSLEFNDEEDAWWYNARNRSGYDGKIPSAIVHIFMLNVESEIFDRWKVTHDAAMKAGNIDLSTWKEQMAIPGQVIQCQRRACQARKAQPPGVPQLPPTAEQNLTRLGACEHDVERLLHMDSAFSRQSVRGLRDAWHFGAFSSRCAQGEAEKLRLIATEMFQILSKSYQREQQKYLLTIRSEFSDPGSSTYFAPVARPGDQPSTIKKDEQQPLAASDVQEPQPSLKRKVADEVEDALESERKTRHQRVASTDHDELQLQKAIAASLNAIDEAQEQLRVQQDHVSQMRARMYARIEKMSISQLEDLIRTTDNIGLDLDEEEPLDFSGVMSEDDVVDAGEKMEEGD